MGDPVSEHPLIALLAACLVLWVGRYLIQPFLDNLP
jgi:hypothetical protein